MNTIDDLDLPKGKITQLKNKGFETLEDLVFYKPLHYFDFLNPKPIQNLRNKEICSVYVEVIRVMDNSKMLEISVCDEKGTPFDIVYFNQPFMKKQFTVGKWYTVGGQITRTPVRFNMTNPKYLAEGKKGKVETQYSKVKGMSDDYLNRSITEAQQIYTIKENIDKNLRKYFGIITRQEMASRMHHPRNFDDVKNVNKRLLVEDMLGFHVRLRASQEHLKSKALEPFDKFTLVGKLKEMLPFELTEGQAHALRAISHYMKEGKRVNALVQGDVGCGKTMVGLFSMVMAAENGYQSVIMAPTNVLAKQHYIELSEYLEPLGIRVGFLSGELTQKEMKDVNAEIKDGTINVVVGTHSVFSDSVVYNKLGCAVVDEEHRFGVEQRKKLSSKGEEGVHVINMSATPIPRSLALTVYGEDVLVLKIATMPNGRKTIMTRRETKELYAFKEMENQVKLGHQAYIVCPFIDDNEEMDEVESVETATKKAIAFFKPLGIKVGSIDGRMKPEVVTEEILKFKNKEYDVLVSTTIIEVGVNVPNATMIYIKSAERFGLAQLHQLRGRVGRGSEQSYCILSSSNETEQADKKLNAMVATTDGLEIAKQDFSLRGMGDIAGNAQSGLNKYIELMGKYPKLSEAVKEYVYAMGENSKAWEHYKNTFV